MLGGCDSGVLTVLVLAGGVWVGWWFWCWFWVGVVVVLWEGCRGVSVRWCWCYVAVLVACVSGVYCGSGWVGVMVVLGVVLVLVG